MAEPQSNSITSEELATRVRRVVGRRFRRDPAAQLEPTLPIVTPKLRNLTAQGYDFVIISLAIFLVTILVLNLSIAGSWRERGNQWGDRARWQRELHAWEQQLVKQEQQLESECQQLAATLISPHGTGEQQQALDQVTELRQRLREANQSLAAISNNQQYTSNGPNRDSALLSVEALRTKREQLIEQQYAARAQYNAEHPTLQAIENQLQELERQLALSEDSSRAEYSAAPESRVQVIENQFLRTASSSPKPRPEPVSDEFTPRVQIVEQRFDQLRASTERFLRDIETQQQTLQQSDQQRANAWEQVANALRAMTRACAVPAALQQAVKQQDELRMEPTLAPSSLLLSLALSLALAGAIVWRANITAAITVPPVKSTGGDELLTVNHVTKQLGCAPAAIVPWDIPLVEEKAVLETTPTVVTGKTMQHKLRLASECLLAVTIAATVLVSMTHGQFGDWLIANPLTAWGRWMGS